MVEKRRCSPFILVGVLELVRSWLAGLPVCSFCAAFSTVTVLGRRGEGRVIMLRPATACWSPSHRWLTSAVHCLNGSIHSSASPSIAASHPAACSSGPDAKSDRHNQVDAHTLFTHRYYVAVGSNVGDRFQNIRFALQHLCETDDDAASSVRLTRTSFLHETAPMYLTNQPMFLNGAVEVETNLSPEALLRRLKCVEVQIGRDLNGVRNGPRPVDLDIILGEERLDVTGSHKADATTPGTRVRPILVEESPHLLIPHPRMAEREFVLAPLAEVAGPNLSHPTLHRTVSALLDDLRLRSRREGEESSPSAVRVLPLPRGRVLAWNQTLVMGVLNVTPDSFSDGGLWTDSVECALEHARHLERDGADVLDVGGESTRPGAKEVRVEEELRRVLPVIEGIRRSKC